MVERGLAITVRQVESRRVGGKAFGDIGAAVESAIDDLGGQPSHQAGLDICG